MGARTRVMAVLGAAVLLGLLGFVGWQEGAPLYQRSQPVAPLTGSEALALPAQVYDPSPYAPSVQDVGPPGPVALVFEGRRAREGFTGEVANPWYAVSARTGDYRRLAGPHLGPSTHRLWLGPEGTKVAWVWPGGVATLDLMTGDASTQRVPGVRATTPLAWSPGSTSLAVGTDPVRLLRPSSGGLTRLPLPGASPASPPAWTTDGRWLTVVSHHRITASGVDGTRPHPVLAPAGELRGPRWSTAGDVAGVHPRPHGNVLRVVHAAVPGGPAEPGSVDDASPPLLTIQGLLGWAGERRVVLTGLRPETGQIEQALVLSLPGNTLRTYMQFPTIGKNWVDVATVSVAADLLLRPSEDFEQPTRPWSPGAKLLLCLLLAVFPVTYYLVAHRPRGA